MTKARATTVEMICSIRDAAPDVTEYDSRIALATRRVKSAEDNDESDLVVWWTVLERLHRLGHNPEWMYDNHEPNAGRVVNAYNNVPEWDDIKMAKTLDFDNGEPVDKEPDDEDEPSEGRSK